MKVNRLSIAILAATMGATSTQSFAQVLEETIVTAQKREQSMQDVPFSVSALSGDRLAQSGVVDMLDLQNVSPSLMMPSSGNPGQGASFRLRGFGSPPFQLGIEPAVATFMDGIYRSRSGIAVNDLVDIARIEILKGPQGSLFGKNTTAGVVHVISNRPNTEAVEGFVQGGYGKYDTATTQGMVNVPLGEKSAVRVAGAYSDGDGYLQNNGPADDSNNTDRYNVRGQWLIMPTDDIDINLSASYGRIDEICCSPVEVANLDDLTTLDGTEPEDDSKDQVYGAEINWDINNQVKLTSVTSYQDFKVSTLVDGDFAPPALLNISEDVKITGFTQELRLSGEVDSLNWTVGAFYSDDDIERDRYFYWGQDIVFTPFPLSPGLGVYDQLEQNGDSWAAFAQGTYSITEKFLVTAGMRYNEENKDGSGEFIQPQPGPLGQVNPSFEASIDESKPTGMFSLQYNWTDSIMTYATYQRGYKAGGINLAREASGVLGQPNEATFDSEGVDNYELGAKTEMWDDQLRLNVALFHTEFSDLQNQIFLPPLFIVRNGEGAEINGLEIEGALAATENLSFNFGMTLLDTSFDDGTDLGGGDIGGRDLPWAPESSASLGWDYARPISGSGLELFWTGSALFRSSYLANSSSDPTTEQGSSQMYNTQLGIRNETWSGMIWCRNCSDKIVKEVQFNNPLPLTGALAYINRPMEYGVAVKYNF